MKKRKITSIGQPLLAPDGRVLSNVRISFLLVDANSRPVDVFDPTTGEHIVGRLEVITDQNGEFEIELFPNTNGDKESYYVVHINSSYVEDFKATLTSGIEPISFYDFTHFGITATPIEIDTIQAYLDNVTQGAQGPKGDKGDTGLTGAKGDKGDKGDTGLQGIKGDTGNTGAQGIQGVKGDTGATGSQGIQGTTGADGISAYQVALNNGFVGTQSAWLASLIGATGAQGIQGVKGDTGEQGLQGIQGVKGDTGSTGLQGIKGDTGEQGIQGAKGDKGDTGAQGIQGIAGVDGTNGVDGQGVPTGGSTGQVLSKIDSTDYNTQWVTPSVSGGGGGEVLVASYVHSGNPTIEPSSLDVNTGIFTCATPHLLGTNTYPCYFFTKDDKVKSLPYEIYNALHTNIGTTTWQIKGLTDTTFILRNNNVDITSYLNAYNTQLNMSNMVVEYTPVSYGSSVRQIILNNLGSLSKYRIVMSGRKIMGNANFSLDGNNLITAANGYINTLASFATSYNVGNKLYAEIIVENKTIVQHLSNIYPDKSRYQFGDSWADIYVRRNMVNEQLSPINSVTFTETYNPAIQNGFTMEVYSLD